MPSYAPVHQDLTNHSIMRNREAQQSMHMMTVVVVVVTSLKEKDVSVYNCNRLIYRVAVLVVMDFHCCIHFYYF